MPATGSPEDVLASCSFCGKPNTAVQTLVAGPGVYICNECVQLSAWVVGEAVGTTAEEAARRRSEYRHRSTEDVLATLPALVRSADRIESEVVTSVSRLRERGTDWQVIAHAAGMSVEAVCRRFGAGATD